MHKSKIWNDHETGATTAAAAAAACRAVANGSLNIARKWLFKHVILTSKPGPVAAVACGSAAIDTGAAAGAVAVPWLFKSFGLER